jgi:anti-sigma factor RsiW
MRCRKMSDTLDKLEIRIGKFLDGELSLPERGLLESELQRDRRAKELFEQMACCMSAVVGGAHEVLDGGRPGGDLRALAAE